MENQVDKKIKTLIDGFNQFYPFPYNEENVKLFLNLFEYFKIINRPEKLPEQFYKYPKVYEVINPESEYYKREKAETDKKGEKIYFYIGGHFPYKNWVDDETLEKMNVAKSLFMEYLKIAPYYIFRKQAFLDSFLKVAYKAAGDKILNPKHWTDFGQEFHRVIYRFLIGIGFTEESSIKASDMFIFLLESDNAYRLVLEDLFTECFPYELQENPRKEIKRLSQIIQKRHVSVYVSTKFKKVAKLVNYLLFVPKFKKAFINSFKSIDFPRLCLDDIDTYWALIRSDYNFLGLNKEERIEFIKEKGWELPKKYDN